MGDGTVKTICGMGSRTIQMHSRMAWAVTLAQIMAMVTITPSEEIFRSSNIQTMTSNLDIMAMDSVAVVVAEDAVSAVAVAVSTSSPKVTILTSSSPTIRMPIHLKVEIMPTIIPLQRQHHRTRSQVKTEQGRRKHRR